MFADICLDSAASLSPCMFLLVELFVGYLAERKISYDKSFFYIYDTSIILSLIVIIYYKQTCTTSDLNYSICFANIAFIALLVNLAFQ